MAYLTHYEYIPLLGLYILASLRVQLHFRQSLDFWSSFLNKHVPVPKKAKLVTHLCLFLHLHLKRKRFQIFLENMQASSSKKQFQALGLRQKSC